MAFSLKQKLDAPTSVDGDGGRDVVAVFLLSIVAGAVLYWLLPEHPLGTWVTGLLTGLATVALVAAQRPARFSSPLTIVAAVVVLTYTVRPAILVQPFTVSLASDLDLAELGAPRYLALGFVVLMAAGAWARRWRMRGRATLPDSETPHRRRRQVTWRGPRVLLASATAAAVVSIGLLVASSMMAAMSLAEAYQSPVLFRAATSSGGRYYLSGVCIALAWVPFWLALIGKGAMGTRARVLLMVTAVVLAVAVTYPFGQRSYFLAPVLGAFAWREITKRRVRAAVVVPAGVAVLAALGLYSTWRAIVGGVSGIGFSLSGTALNVSARLDSFDFFAQTYQTFDSGLLYGRSILDLILQPIPRAMYPEKPSQTSAYLIGLQQPEVGRGFSPEYGLITELWINGGLVLLVVGGFAFGWWLMSADRWTLLAAASPRRALMTMPFVSIPAQWALAGFNSFATIYLFLFGSIYGAVALIVTRRTRD